MKSRKSKVLLSIVLVAVLLFSNSNTIPAQAETGSYTRLCNVPDEEVTLKDGKTKVKCTNLGTMCIVDSTLYCIKTDSTDSASVLYIIKNYTSSSATITKKTIKNKSGQVTSIGHGNGMTYYNGSIYVATMIGSGSGSQIVRINTSGVIQEGFTYNHSISSISYSRGGYFIVNGKQDTTGYRKYDVVSLASGKASRYKSFYVKIADNRISQDTHYEDGTFYIVRTVDDGNLNKNKLIIVDLSATIVDGKKYSYDVVDINGSGSGKFEIESLDIAGGKVIACANSGTDGIFKLSYSIAKIQIITPVLNRVG